MFDNFCKLNFRFVLVNKKTLGLTRDSDDFAHLQDQNHPRAYEVRRRCKALALGQSDSLGL